MKKASILFCSFIILCYYAHSQDVIIKRNGDEIKTQVEEISQNEIKYKRFDNLEGPSYTIFKSEVFIIKYQNGTKEVITSTETPEKPKEPTPSYSAPVTVQSNPNLKYPIEGEGWKYYQEGRRLSEASLFRVLKEAKKEDALKEYQKGKAFRTSGTVLTAVSIPLMISGPILALIGAGLISVYNTSVDVYNNSSSSFSTAPSEDTYNTGNTMMGVGYAMFGTGVACVVSGGVIKGLSKKKYKRATELYNATL